MSITQINDLKKNTNENVFDDKHEKIYIKEKSEFIQTDLDKSPNNNKAKTNNDNEIKNNSSPSTKQTKKPRAFNVTEVDNIHQLADDKLKEYQKIIDEHPDQLFLEISPEIVSKWKLILFSSVIASPFPSFYSSKASQPAVSLVKSIPISTSAPSESVSILSASCPSIQI